jgi:hypothetical protein
MVTRKKLYLCDRAPLWKSYNSQNLKCKKTKEK